MPLATDKADPWGQFLNTFMLFTKGKSHLFLGHIGWFAETTPRYQTMEHRMWSYIINKMWFEETAADLLFLMKHLPFFPNKTVCRP